MLFFAKQKLSIFPNPQLEAEAILSTLLEVNKSYLRTHSEEKISFLKRWKFLYYLHLRSHHFPLAYIRGWKDWCGMRIIVTPSVLIPRDETEVLIQKIISSDIHPQTILDMGTGSGCIAIALAKKYDTANVTALDLSRKALFVAKQNITKQRVVVDLKYSDLLSIVPLESRFDLIVANLPYVPVNFPITKSVQKEPQEALFSGDDGLGLLRRFATELQEKRIQFDALWLEFLPQQWKEIQSVFKKWNIEPYRDIGGDIYFAKISGK